MTIFFSLGCSSGDDQGGDSVDDPTTSDTTIMSVSDAQETVTSAMVPTADATDPVEQVTPATEPPREPAAEPSSVPTAELAPTTEPAGEQPLSEPATDSGGESTNTANPANTADDPATGIEQTSAWSPIGKPWLVALYDADSRASIVESSGRVSQWKDLSGNEHHAVQTVPSNRPHYNASDEQANGRPSLSSMEDGHHSGMLLPSLTYRRLFVSIQYKSGTESAFHGGFHGIFSAASQIENSGNGEQWRAIGYLGQSTLFREALSFDQSPRINGGTDTPDLLPLPLSTVELDHGSTIAQATAIGHVPAGNPAWSWPGPYRCFLFTDGSESLTDLLRIEGWMAYKDGTQRQLPVDHPYRYVKPGNNPQTSSPQPEGYVLHLIGQSNAMGRVNLPSLRDNNNGMRLPNGTVVSALSSPNDAPGNYGVDIVLAETWETAKPPILVKTGQGGVSARYFHDRLFATHLATLDSLQVPYGYEHVALWVQGESDALQGGDVGAAYEADEAAVFDAIDAKVPGIRIFSVLLNPDWNFNNNVRLGAGIRAVNDAKSRNAESRPNVSVIGGYYSLQPDYVHYNEAGLEQMAYDFLQHLESR